MIHLKLFTGIQYIKFTAVGERAVHITITNIYIYIYNLTNFLSAFSGKYSLISLFLYIESYIVI